MKCTLGTKLFQQALGNDRTIKGCCGGAEASWVVFYHNNQTDKVCDQCYIQIHLDVSYRLPIFSTLPNIGETN